MKINIKGPIIPSNHQWIYDWLGMEATSPKKVASQLEKANNKDIEVEINSGGGSVFDASEIYTALKNYPGKVTGKIVGLAASAASVIAMAADNLQMSPTAQMMIHNASSRSKGDYRDMDHMSNILKNVNQTVANAYSMKSGKTYQELLSMMDDETWLTAQQAKEHNLIDEIMFQDDAQFVASNEDGGLLPQKVIDKIRNEFAQSQFNIQNNAGETQITNEDDKFTNIGDEEVMNLEELKNNHPDLYNQIKNEGYEEGVKAENARIKSIEDNALPGYDDLVNKAKYEEPINGDQLAGKIIRAQKEQGKNFLQNRNEDAEDINNVKGSDAPEGNITEEKEIENTANLMAGYINKKRGGAN